MADRVALKNPHRFKKGERRPANAGRKVGSVNKTTRLLREAIIMAAENVGGDNKGKGQLVGYLETIAKKHPDLFCVLLGRVLPMQLVGPSDNTPKDVHVHLTLPEMRQRLEERGIPGVYDPPIKLIEAKATPVRTNGGATNGHG